MKKDSEKKAPSAHATKEIPPLPPSSKNFEGSPLRPVRGMRDILGKDAETFQHIIQTLQHVVSLHGFSFIETPIVEFTNLFERCLGEGTDVVGKEMFSFLDHSEGAVSLRPEGTASIVRALINNKLTQTLPQRWFYWGPMFRYDRPQKGRYRQFYQFGVECLGEASPLCDADMIASAWKALQSLGIKNAALSFNSIGDTESRERYRTYLVEYFSEYEKDLSVDSQRRLRSNPLRILDSKDQKDQDIAQDAKNIWDFFTKDAWDFFDEVQNLLKELCIPYTIDPMLVRGLDYYDHATFEIKAPVGASDQKLALLGGGRYNGLVQQMGGGAVPAIGWAAGVDRLILALEQDSFPKRELLSLLFVSEKEKMWALNFANDLRDALFANPRLSVLFLTSGDLSKRMKVSERLGATLALLIGEDEIKGNFVTCKFFAPKGLFAEGHEEKVKLHWDTLHLEDLLKFLDPLFAE
ncbi:histidine--tRNA ligase [Alphaproteobacteria bacterium]|nr:histidine--tRNA ligase [Alphaproteobacteria bacterium]GHS98797.1 histidine--tRNA ligase [Alphaproteobacteria bacterium]